MSGWPVSRGSGAQAPTGRHPERHLEDAASGCDRQGWWDCRGSWSDPRRGRPSRGWDPACPARSRAPRQGKYACDIPPRSHALRGNAVLAAPAARTATQRWSVGTCSHAGAWELKEINA